MTLRENEGLLEELVAAIETLPGGRASVVQHELGAGDGRYIDAIVEAHVHQARIVLLVELKRELFPRDVHHAAWQLDQYRRALENQFGETIPLLAAQSVSPGARDLLKELNIGFYDLGGSLFIPAPQAYVFVDRPQPRKATKVFYSIFEGQKGRVLQEIFSRRDEWLTVKDLARLASVAPSTASTTLAELERRHWAVTEGAGPAKARRLIAVGALLDEWRDYTLATKPPHLRRFYVPGYGLEDLAHQLDVACVDGQVRYAVTGEVAAHAYTPWLSSISQLKCRIEPGSGELRVLEDLGAREVSEGWNLGLIGVKSSDDIRLGERIDMRLAPPIQIYLDLLQGSGRSKDLAEHFRQEKLGV